MFQDHILVLSKVLYQILNHSFLLHVLPILFNRSSLYFQLFRFFSFFNSYFCVISCLFVCYYGLFICAFVYSLTHLFIHSILKPLLLSFILLLTLSFIHSFTHFFLKPFVCSFILLFVGISCNLATIFGKFFQFLLLLFPMHSLLNHRSSCYL